MRPGPGMVVMALAFISVARRGGTSQSNIPNFKTDSDLLQDNEAGHLAQINPWLSACDVANPIKAPDLQGYCSENGTILPKHWVNEGPGPPVCPKPCVELLKLEYLGKASSHLSMREKHNYYEKQQCLEYLDDDRDSSPEQICKRQSRDIQNILRVLRLRSCCERSVSSALHNEAMLSVVSGGHECVKILRQLIDTDGIASRITCGLNEILFRYDCRQIYSIKHGCNDCKEAYRRWVCSTLIPYFSEPNDIRQHQRQHSTSDRSSTGKEAGVIDDIPFHTHSHSETLEDLLVSKLLSRSKRKSELISQRMRIRPCLKVCQTVEEYCPYMLPGDRAPGYNTQYAGEPTFLCMDPNIPETGEQLIKSNNGPDSCCYQYCSQESVYQSICTFCNVSIQDEAKSATALNTTLAEDKMNRFENAHEFSKLNNEFPPQTCQLVTGLSLTTSRCEIPYYASSAAKAATPFHWILTSTASSKHIFVAQAIILLSQYMNSYSILIP